MSSVFDEIKEFDGFVSENIIANLYYFAMNSQKWGIQSSSRDSAKNKFLCLEIHKEENEKEIVFVVLNILKKLEKELQCEFEIGRIYFNGQFFGMPGTPHFDSEDKDHYTYLMYINPEWDILWGGQTIFFDKFFDSTTQQIKINTSKVKLYYPNKNLSLFFPSNVMHYAESPTKFCDQMRITLAFKLKKIGVLNNE